MFIITVTVMKIIVIKQYKLHGFMTILDVVENVFMVGKIIGEAGRATNGRTKNNRVSLVSLDTWGSLGNLYGILEYP